MTPTTIVRTYHDATKHHFNRFARSLGYLDWATQPNPFRRYDGAPVVELWQGTPDPFPYDDLYTTIEPSAPRPITLERVSLLLRYAMGLSAWKQYGRSRWALRVNPSSGNLHPTESYVIARPLDVEGAHTRLYHYAPDGHVLEQRCVHHGDLLATLGLSATHSLVVGISTIHWREAWKYGERAFRYCQHDTGHAIAAVVLAARMLGWEARLCSRASMAAIASLLGLDRDRDFREAEREEPQCLLIAGVRGGEVGEPCPGDWTGTANRLSPERVDWPSIDEAAAATRMPTVSVPESAPVAQGFSPAPHAAPPDAARIILQRRSALAFDGRSRTDRATFLRMLARVMPADRPPWTALWWPARVHLALFVHRVDDVDPGIYMLIRNAASEALVRAELQREFSWTRADGALPLFQLVSGNCQRMAARLSCDQEIAADGFFSLGMIAEFDPALDDGGAGFYRHLFWECGAIGQVLYLEAEAAGARSTGIGCFYDDPVHETLGIFSHRLQSLYHFTVGMPVEDPRLTTEPGYEWEK